jgi:hypothetical protein
MTEIEQAIILKDQKSLFYKMYYNKHIMNEREKRKRFYDVLVESI